MALTRILEPNEIPDLMSCPHCGAKVAADMEHGFVVRDIDAHYMITCPCGISTKICQTSEHLKKVWNSRRNKPYVMQKIEVGSDMMDKLIGKPQKPEDVASSFIKKQENDMEAAKEIKREAAKKAF